MNRFYTSAIARGDYIYVRGYENGKRFTEKVHYKPYVFVKKAEGFYRTLSGQPVEKIEFDSIQDARAFVQQYSDVSGFDIYGLTNWVYPFIHDEFPGEIKYDPTLVSVVSLDIETKSDEGMPDPDTAEKEITAVTFRKNGRSLILGCGDFVSPDESTIKYVKCADELALLRAFIYYWTSEEWSPDIVTGWNVEFFDITYIVNRIVRVLGQNEAKRLSPIGVIKPRTMAFQGREQNTYDILGVAVLDYLQLYKKFSFKNQESYKLDYIASVELGVKKLDYSEYGSLHNLYTQNHQLFIEYNNRDSVLIEMMEAKLKFIEQVMALAYDAKVNYTDTLATVRPWDVIIHNYLLDQRIVIPQHTPDNVDFDLLGGYVKDVQIGMHEWVVSFDLNSLYPHLIMQYNISPETMVGRVGVPSIDELIAGKRFDVDARYAYAANGCMYSKEKQGFLPALMEKMYDDRKKYKDQMIDAKKRLEAVDERIKKGESLKAEKNELVKEVARLHNMQLAKKIQLNSAYGALANPYFRWFDISHASAITYSGQLSIRWIEKKINEKMNAVMKTTGVDYVIASDTDSIYINMGELVRKGISETNPIEITKLLDAWCESVLQPYIDSCYVELANIMSAYQQKMKMKRETIADRGIWTAKKNYILNAWNVEGVQYDEPHIKMQGIAAVRSSTPAVCRTAIKDAIAVIMKGSETSLQSFVSDFRSRFETLELEDVASPRGVPDITKWKDPRRIYTKGTPINVRAALLYNSLLDRYKLTTYEKIKDGDKIKYIALSLPNPIHEDVIGFLDNIPQEFGLRSYIDWDKQFEKTFIDPIKKITDVLGWDPIKRSTLSDFFN